MTLDELTDHFVKNQSYLETGAPKLAKQFNTTVEHINNAKHYAKRKLIEKLQDEIAIGEVLPPYRQETISLKDFARSIGIDMDEDIEMMDEVKSLDEWEEKVKWVKTKDESKLFVKKKSAVDSDELDFKKEFIDFVHNYNNTESTGINLKELKSTDNVLLVYMSDKHIGAETKEGSLFKNEWNKEEFANRMGLLAKEIIRLNELYHFEKIILFDLGDSIDGQDGMTTRKGHSLPQNMSNREVYNVFMNVHLDFFYTLSGYVDCPLAFITAGESNHGGDMEYICFKSLEAVLNLKFPLVETFIGDKFVEHYEIGEHCFIVCHGKDVEDMKFPLPKNLNEKTELYFKKYIDAHSIKSKYIHVVKGDLHLSNSEYGEFFRYKNVLSMYGSSKWVQTNFMVNTKGVSMDILSRNTITEHQLFM